MSRPFWPLPTTFQWHWMQHLGDHTPNRTGSEGCPQASVERARLGGTERTRIGECRAAICEVGDSVCLEEGAIGRVAVIENVVDARIDLKGLVDLIGGAKIEDGVAGQF